MMIEWPGSGSGDSRTRRHTVAMWHRDRVSERGLRTSGADADGAEAISERETVCGSAVDDGGSAAVSPDFYETVLSNIDEGVFAVDSQKRVVYWSSGLQNISGYAASAMVGASCPGDYLACVDVQGRALCPERCPLTPALADGTACSTDVIIRNCDGRRIPVSLRSLPRRALRDEPAAAFGVVDPRPSCEPSQAHTAFLDDVAHIEPGTGLANWQLLRITLKARLDEMPRYGRVFGVLLVSAETCAGNDYSPSVVSKALLASSRSSDTVGRLRDGRFLCVMPNVTKRDQLSSIGNRLRLLAEKSDLTSYPGVVPTAVTVGATLAQAYDTVDSLLHRAQTLLDRSRVLGSNRVFMDL